MPPRRCVVQDCNQVSDKDLGISMHTSPASGSANALNGRDLCVNIEITSIRRVRLVYAPSISLMTVSPMQCT